MKILFLDEENFVYSKNIKIVFLDPVFGNDIYDINNMCYGSIIKHPIDNNYYTYICNGPLYKQKVSKYKLVENNFKYINSYNLYQASHNAFLFVDKDNTVNLVGGQSLFKNNYDISKYSKYEDIFYIENDSSLACYNFNSKKLVANNIIINPYIPCPYYMNGLHLFKEDTVKNEFICQNNNLPIINGLHDGRMEGYYSMSINKNKGLLVYDSISSMFFSPKEECYFLYQRSNFNRCCRLILCSKSKDKINWCSFKYINICNTNIKNNIGNYRDNYYLSNIFFLDNTDYYISFMPYSKYDNKNSFFINSNCSMYFSLDGINWKFGKELIKIENSFHTSPTYSYFISGKPVEMNNNHIYYLYVKKKQKIVPFIFKEYEYSFLTSDNCEISEIETKYIDKKYNNLIINAEIFDYLNIYIKKNNQILKEFSSCDKIDNKISTVSWNKNKVLPEPPYSIFLNFKNAKIYYLELI